MKTLTTIFAAVSGLLALSTGLSQAATVAFDPGTGMVDVSFSGIVGTQTVTLSVNQDIVYSCNALTSSPPGQINSDTTVCGTRSTSHFASIVNPGTGEAAHLITLASANVTKFGPPGPQPSSTTVTALDPTVHIVVPLGSSTPGFTIDSTLVTGLSGNTFTITNVMPSITETFFYSLSFDDSLTARFGPPQNEDVPLPTALPLLAAALGGLGAVARKKKKASRSN
jgi:hypothetical protein